MDAIAGLLGLVLILVLILALIYWLFATVAEMAQRREQNQVVWVVVALLINPILAMVVLWLFVPISKTLYRSPPR